MVRIADNKGMALKHPLRLSGAALVVVGCLVVIGFITPAHAQFGELVVFESPGNTVYYLDADTGDDENPGTRADRAWKTLGRINTTRFAPGDTIYIKTDTVYHGRLFPKGAGIPGRPITINSFGKGARPVIHAGGKTSAALLLENTNAWHIKNLELTNTGDEPEAFRYGLSVLAEDTGTVGDFQLTNLFVHDVNGSDEPGLGEGSAIIFRNRGTNNPSRYDGLIIEGCTITDAGRHGIHIQNGYTEFDRWYGNVNVVIRENTVRNVAGDGIRVTGCDNAMVEYNTVHAAGLSGSAEAGGVSLAWCTNALVQFNQVTETVGTESAALYSGFGSHENTYQFNFTRDNAGAMIRVLAGPVGGVHVRDAANTLTTARYNISQNDAGAFIILGRVQDARLHNNTVFSEPDTHGVAVRLTEKWGGPSGITIANNLFYTEGTATFDLGTPDTPVALPQADDAEALPAITFQNNAYFGDHARPEDETGAVTADPMLVEPGTGLSIDDGLAGYQTQPDSPLRGAGIRVPSHGRYDFWANPVPAGAPIDIGAHQAPSDNQTSPDPDTSEPAASIPEPTSPVPESTGPAPDVAEPALRR
jgi:parallel beta helix pectate lyase-like protein